MKKTWRIRINTDDDVTRPLNAQDRLLVIRGIEIGVDDLGEAQRGTVTGTERPLALDIRRLKYALEHAHDHEGEVVGVIPADARTVYAPRLHDLLVRLSEGVNLWVHAFKEWYAAE